MLYVVFFINILSYIFGNTYAQYPCPEPNDIKPCVCVTQENNRIDIDCSGIKDETQLSEIFHADFPFLGIQKLTIIGDPDEDPIPLSKIDHTTFHHKTFDEVIISHTKLNSIGLMTFANSSNSLHTLEVTDNSELTEFPFEMVQQSPNLVKLYLFNNNIKHMSDLHSTTLEELNLSYNKGLYFGLTTFRGAPHIKDLDLKGIELKHIPENIFSYLDNLEIIDLGSNLLTGLDTDSLRFKNPTVKELKLNGNQLQSDAISRESISGLGSQSYVFLQHNLLTSIDELVWKSVFDQALNDGNPANDLFVFDDNPLSCGCEVAWLVMNSDYLDVLAIGATCDESGKEFHELDPNFYEVNC